MEKYNELLSELYRIFNFFNEKFDLKLEKPIITIASANGKNALGWFGNNYWCDDVNEYDEINVCAEYLNDGSYEAVDTVLHEMAHLINAKNGIKDCNHVGYHNKKFKKTAESLGLIVERTKKGYNNTKLSDEIYSIIDNELNLKEELFTLHRKPKDKISSGMKKNMSLSLPIEYEDKVEQLTKELNTKKKDITKMAIDNLYESIFNYESIFK